MASRLDLPTQCPSIEAWERCYMGAPPTLNTLRRTFTALLRWAFSDVTHMDGFSEELGCLTWSAGGDSQMNIQAASVNDPGDTEHVPGILISCGKEGIRYDRAGLSSKVAESPDMAAHSRSYIAKVQMQFVCSAYDADTVCFISDYVTLFLAAMEPKLRDTFGWLLDYTIVAQTEPEITQKLENTTKWYVSNVILDLTYAYSVFVARESKRLKDFTMAVSDK